MSKILITGGAGFIGSNLVKKYYKKHKIVVVDDLSMGKKENIEKYDNVTFYEVSVLDNEFMINLLKKENFDYIFHLAAVASVADSINRPIETNQVNFISTINILNTLKEINNNSLKRFVFASSAAIYGDEKSLPKRENSMIKPMTPYAIDKFASEKYTLMYNELYDIPTSCVRFFNVYGPNQNSSSPYSGVISIILDCFENKNKEFILYGDGSQTRDFVFVEDVISALDLVAHSIEAKGNVYNVGTGIETSLNSLINSVSRILDKTIEIKKLPARNGDINRSYSSIDEIKTIGYKPHFTIDKGLEIYINYLGINNA